MNLAGWLWQQGQAAPVAPAVFLGETLVADYGALQAQAAGVAGWMLSTGVQAGDRVAIFMKNVPEYLPVLYGIWAAGAVAVPINAKLHGREAAYILDNSGAVLVFATAAEAAVLAPCAVRIVNTGDGLPQGAPADVAPRGPDDLAWLFYTSGTTGQPKGVQITHGMLAAMADSYQSDVDVVTSQDAAIYAAPMSHGAGLYNLMHVRMGARHVFPASGGFDAAQVLDLAAHHGRAHMFAAPTIVTRLTSYAAAAGRDGTGLRTVIYAGGPMYVADILRARAQFGDVFVQIYGQGECPMAITVLRRSVIADTGHVRWRERLASVGVAQTGMELRIDGDGPVGEIMVHGAAVMPGYWRNDAATADTLRDGWLATGDVGALDADGYLTLMDRSKDMIISGGSNIYPREVEEVLLLHPNVSEVSVVGRAHADWGEEVVACVVGQASAAELDALCRDHIARFKAPKAYVWLKTLPKNNYGKVLKTDLRKQVAG
jgi:long-chain acyl-CoA synthetase